MKCICSFTIYKAPSRTLKKEGTSFLIGWLALCQCLRYCQASWLKNNMIRAEQKRLCTGVYIFKKQVVTKQLKSIAQLSFHLVERAHSMNSFKRRHPSVSSGKPLQVIDTWVLHIFLFFSHRHGRVPCIIRILSVGWRTTTKCKESWEIKKHPPRSRMRKWKDNVCFKICFSIDHPALPSDLSFLSLFFPRVGSSFSGVSHNATPSRL